MLCILCRIINSHPPFYSLENKQQPNLSWSPEVHADVSYILKALKLNQLPGVCAVCVSLLFTSSPSTKNVFVVMLPV